MKSLFFLTLIFSLPSLAQKADPNQSFKAADFVKAMSEEGTWTQPSYKAAGIEFKGSLEFNAHNEYYTQSMDPRYNNKGPFKTREEALANKDPKNTHMGIQEIPDYGRQRPLTFKYPNKEKSQACFEQQSQEIQKALNDPDINNFFSYLELKDVRLKNLDLYYGVPAKPAPPKAPSTTAKVLGMAFAPVLANAALNQRQKTGIYPTPADSLVIHSVVDQNGECHSTTVADIKTLIAPYVEQHRQLLARRANEPDEKKKKELTGQISAAKLQTRKDLHELFEKHYQENLDAFRTPSGSPGSTPSSDSAVKTRS